ncbi:MAG: hypothetical protein JNL11_02225 [Bdellovibrionaceae bacterium]|nr:hypothetical protein [Pseudobdellovibrionaceae bacterium]
MKVTILGFTLLGTVLLSIGCAHTHKVLGRQDKVEIPEGVRVNVGSPHVKEGDVVDIYRRKCKKFSTGKGNSTETCTRTFVAQAPIIKILSEDESIMSPPAGFKLETDMFVEDKNSEGEDQMRPLICPQPQK